MIFISMVYVSDVLLCRCREHHVALSGLLNAKCEMDSFAWLNPEGACGFWFCKAFSLVQ